MRNFEFCLEFQYPKPNKLFFSFPRQPSRCLLSLFLFAFIFLLCVEFAVVYESLRKQGQTRQNKVHFCNKCSPYMQYFRESIIMPNVLWKGSLGIRLLAYDPLRRVRKGK